MCAGDVGSSLGRAGPVGEVFRGDTVVDVCQTLVHPAALADGQRSGVADDHGQGRPSDLATTETVLQHRHVAQYICGGDDLAGVPYRHLRPGHQHLIQGQSLDAFGDPPCPQR